MECTTILINSFFLSIFLLLIMLLLKCAQIRTHTHTSLQCISQCIFWSVLQISFFGSYKWNNALKYWNIFNSRYNIWNACSKDIQIYIPRSRKECLSQRSLFGGEFCFAGLLIWEVRIIAHCSNLHLFNCWWGCLFKTCLFSTWIFSFINCLLWHYMASY